MSSSLLLMMMMLLLLLILLRMSYYCCWCRCDRRCLIAVRDELHTLSQACTQEGETSATPASDAFCAVPAQQELYHEPNNRGTRNTGEMSEAWE